MVIGVDRYEVLCSQMYRGADRLQIAHWLAWKRAPRNYRRGLSATKSGVDCFKGSAKHPYRLACTISVNCPHGICLGSVGVSLISLLMVTGVSIRWKVCAQKESSAVVFDMLFNGRPVGECVSCVHVVATLFSVCPFLHALIAQRVLRVCVCLQDRVTLLMMRAVSCGSIS